MKPVNTFCVILIAIGFLLAGFNLGNVWSELNREAPIPFPIPGDVFITEPNGETYEWICDWELVGEAK